ncbi:MAG TPA: 4'-phosphopantetheinyl transferase superfamily protein [Pseudomonadales bacterium]|nr:4'-phosphopantetheinyl transferase superfamily protein [Pseudomonadales bacterium]
MVLLPSDEVHVWLMRRPLTLDASLRALTTADEQQRANNMTSLRRQCEWLAGRALLRQCLAHYTGQDSLGLVFDKTESGKPFLDIHAAPVFNLSHGPGWIACAVAQADNIGIDIDSEARRNRTDEIAARYFHPLEQAELAQTGDEQERKQLFFRQWTLKEAYIKAIGETINGVRLHELAFESVGGGNPRARFSLPAGDWQFMHCKFDGDHHLALACQRSQCDTGNVCYRFWLWDAATQSRHELTDKWPCKI